jgi:peptide/nickel transport system ATP-binding protein
LEHAAGELVRVGLDPPLRCAEVHLPQQVQGSLVGLRLRERRVKSYPHELSGGMLQRVLIAMALSTEPRLIVADEPTSALDVTVQAGILDLLLEMQERTGVAILLITHDLGVARLMSDRIHVMHRGLFVEDGPVEQVVDHPAHDYTRALLAAIPELGEWDDPEDLSQPGVPEVAALAEPTGIPATNRGPRP